MKKIIICLLSLLLLCSCSQSNNNIYESETVKTVSTQEKVKSVWITYYELSEITKSSKTSKDFEKKISSVFSDLKKKGFNTVTVQVKPCADVFYKSSYFPLSHYCFGVEGGEMAYDPLSIMIDVAHNKKLRIEAWLNPYRVCQGKDTSILSKESIAKKWLDELSPNIYVGETNIYFNPASNEVISLIVDSTKELVTNYDVDAVHFDDYFYPTTDENIDKNAFDEYKSSNANATLSDFRREKVSYMVSEVYKAIKSVNNSILFGISPCGNIENDYNSLYADVYKWVSEKGYVDYICPQIYYGFENETQPFMKTVKKWNDMSSCDIYIGLPLYKCNESDEYAGSGKNEFKNNKNIISRQIDYINKVESIDGIYIFSYSFLYNESINDELSSMFSALKKY